MHHHEPLDAVAVGEGRREPLDPRRYRPAFTLRLLEPVLHEDQWGRRRADPSRRCAPWMNRPSGATSHGVYQLGASPASAARRWNSTSGSPTRGGGPIATVTAIMVLSPLRKNSSRPFRAQSGVEPPPLETCTLAPPVFGKGRMNTSMRPVSSDSYASQRPPGRVRGR